MMFSFVIPFLLVLCVCGEETGITKEFVLKNNDFGIRLYKALSKEAKGNLVFSSHTTRLILALVSLGASGQTANQLKSIKTASRVYLAEGLAVDPKFSKIATEYFNSGIENVDFKSSKKTADYINSWVEERTNNKIKNLIDGKRLNEHTRLILVNALYFEGKWKNSFSVKDTKVADFFVSKHESVKIPMMETTEHILVFRNDEMKVTGLMLPYENPKVMFCMFLPDEFDGLPQVEEKAEELWKVRNFTKQYIKLYLPKFRLESTLDMIPALKDIGIENLFSKTDLTGITREPVLVSSVNQKVYVEVNEHGTGANSGTAGDGEKGVLPKPNESVMVLKADHAFGFTILYEGVSLIVGRFAHL
ncbi:hypothetical protein WA026_005624 [Henosepilachna vigintioctopunctata]|uniref:Serpin domain-containing protein n=1 Tax=Henosepilachna vigintioctopunctata TaxID=420089 RepID=A0AAW1U4J2_9CUCU